MADELKDRLNTLESKISSLSYDMLTMKTCNICRKVYARDFTVSHNAGYRDYCLECLKIEYNPVENMLKPKEKK